MEREQVCALVSGIQAHDLEERNDQARTLRWLNTADEICRRAKPAVPVRHLVVRVVILNRTAHPNGEEAHEWILMQRRGATRWEPIGTHVQAREHPLEAVVRVAARDASLSNARVFDGKPLFVTAEEIETGPVRHTDIALWYVVAPPKKTEVSSADLAVLGLGRAVLQDAISFDSQRFQGVWRFSYSLLKQMPGDELHPHLPRFFEKWLNILTTRKMLPRESFSK
jgi:hypothetical protein